MYMKKLALILAGCGFLALPAFSATTISANNVNDGETAASFVILLEGTRVPTGTGTIALGTFTGAITENSTNISEILANFEQFGESSTFGGVGDGVDGLYSLAIDGTVSASLAGQNMYTVIGNGSTLESSSHLLILQNSVTFVADPNPNPNAIVGDEALSTIAGGYGTTGNDPGLDPFSNFYQLEMVIPEPSTVLLTSLGAGFLLFRRRR